MQSKIQVNGTTLISQTCVDATSEAAARAKKDAYMKANCSRLDTRQEGGKWVSDSTCTFAGTTVTGHTVTTMDGDPYNRDDDRGFKLARALQARSKAWSTDGDAGLDAQLTTHRWRHGE